MTQFALLVINTMNMHQIVRLQSPQIATTSIENHSWRVVEASSSLVIAKKSPCLPKNYKKFPLQPATPSRGLGGQLARFWVGMCPPRIKI